MNAAIRILLAAATLFMPAGLAAQEEGAGAQGPIEEAISFWLPGALREGGALKITPEGEGFSASLDMAAAVGKAIAPWEIRSLTPIVHAIRPRENGQWDFSSKARFDLSAELLAGNRSNTAQLRITELSDSGTYDPALGFIRQAEISLADLATSLRSGQESIRGSL
jgi:hypothetical protein